MLGAQVDLHFNILLSLILPCTVAFFVLMPFYPLAIHAKGLVSRGKSLSNKPSVKGASLSLYTVPMKIALPIEMVYAEAG